MKTALQKQGSYAISTDELDPSVTINEIQQAPENSDLSRTVQKVMKTARMFASNVAGTDPYWHSTRFEMKVINFYQQYIDDNQLSIFHTGSLAEHHEPALRKLLSQYVQELDGTLEADSQKILDDDTAFSIAVQTYKHIVTHYLSGKMENWLGIFMGPIFGVIAALIVFEFAKTRGAIHYHSLLICDNENFQQKLQESLEILALSIHESVKKLNTFICNNWLEERDATNFEVRPDLLICAKNGEKRANEVL